MNSRSEIIMLALIPILSLILFFIGIQLGRAIEVNETLEMREKITASWLQDCTKPIVVMERGKK